MPPKAFKPLKQQPKNPGRRNREEREARDKAENERKQARAEAAAAEAAADAASRRAQYGIPSASALSGAAGSSSAFGRGRGRGGLSAIGGRGGFMGQREAYRQEQNRHLGHGTIIGSSKSGQLGATEDGSNLTAAATTSSRVTRSRPSDAGPSKTKIKTEPGVPPTTLTNDLDTSMLETTWTGTAAKQDDEDIDAAYISSDAEETAESKGVNVEYIDLISDEEDSLNAHDQYSRARGFAPVRLQRHEHEDRDVTVTTSKEVGNAARRTDSQTQREQEVSLTLIKDRAKKQTDFGSTSGSRRWKGVYEDEDEDGAEAQDHLDADVDPEVDAMDVDSSTRTSNRSKRREKLHNPDVAKDIEDAVMLSSEDGELEDEPSADQARRRSRAEKHGKGDGGESIIGKKAASQPVFHSVAEEREWSKRKDDLRVMQEELGRIQLNEGDSTAVADGRTDAIYLFQLPPVIPELQAPIIKQEIEDGDIANPAQSTARTQQKQQQTTASKIPDDKANVMLIDGEDGDAAPVQADAEPSKQITAQKTPFASGYVGKLRIRESGRAELVWGGTSMEVNLGTNPSFLQSAVLTRYTAADNSRPRIDKEYHGEAISLGQVRGKLVVTPDWEKILR